MLVRAVGVAAFSLVMPITFAVIAVLIFVTLSYLEVVKVYTKAGGAYVVSRENFGPERGPGRGHVASDRLHPHCRGLRSGRCGSAHVGLPFAHRRTTVWIAAGLVILIAYINLRGVREAGTRLRPPTYFFVANMVILITLGTCKAIQGTLHAHSHRRVTPVRSRSATQEAAFSSEPPCSS